MEIINWFEGAQNSRNKHFGLIKGGILTASSLSSFHFPLLWGDKWETARLRMKIHWNIVIQHVPAFSLQNNAWRDKQASLVPHSCQNAFAFFAKKTCSYSSSEKPATIESWCYDRKQIKHLSHCVPNEPLNYNLEIDSGHSRDYWSSKCLSQCSCQKWTGVL